MKINFEFGRSFAATMTTFAFVSAHITNRRIARTTHALAIAMRQFEQFGRQRRHKLLSATEQCSAALQQQRQRVAIERVDDALRQRTGENVVRRLGAAEAVVDKFGSVLLEQRQGVLCVRAG